MIQLPDRTVSSVGELTDLYDVRPDDLFAPGPDGPGRPELAPWRATHTTDPRSCLCGVDTAAVLDRAGLTWTVDHDYGGDLVVQS